MMRRAMPQVSCAGRWCVFSCCYVVIRWVVNVVVYSDKKIVSGVTGKVMFVKIIATRYAISRFEQNREPFFPRSKMVHFTKVNHSVTWKPVCSPRSAA